MTTILTPKIAQPLRCSKMTIFYEQVLQVLQVLFWQALPYKEEPVRLESARHRLRTPNEGINQRYLKKWADVVYKICFGRT